MNDQRHVAEGAQKSLLQRWLEANGFTWAALARACKPPMIRQQLEKFGRVGRDIRLGTMVRIRDAASVLAGREVRMEEIFPIAPPNEE